MGENVFTTEKALSGLLRNADFSAETDFKERLRERLSLEASPAEPAAKGKVRFSVVSASQTAKKKKRPRGGRALSLDMLSEVAAAGEPFRQEDIPAGKQAMRAALPDGNGRNLQERRLP